MKYKLCLAGNPNCGKTTLFNALTGTYQKVGNFSGVTVESKEGSYTKDKKIKITDLPGLYSLSAGSADERAVIKYLKETPPEVIINVLDGTNLERNLYLTCELTSLKIPMVLAVNMCDDLEKNGVYLNAEKLAAVFGVPVVKISALKGTNLDALMEQAVNAAKPPLPPVLSATSGESLSEKYYAFVESKIGDIISKKQTRAEKFTRRADDVLTHKVWGIPIFAAVIALVYFLSMKIGGGLGNSLSAAIDRGAESLAGSMRTAGAAEWVISLVSDAVIKGLGTVISFLPQILVLFLLLSVIEESGYASRVAFNLDRLFRSFGLGGKSMLPLIVSCGCTVTGIMATRVIEDENERRMTVFLAPFMPCGAKTAVFGWFSYKFFGGSALVATSMYFLSVLSVAVFGKILKGTKAFGGSESGFLLEMPTLRFPSAKDMFFVLWVKVKDFLFKAGTVIFTVSVILWFLQNVGFGGYTTDVEESFLYIVGNAVKYFFYPLGFCSWQTSVAVLSGILAKEAVIETMSIVAAEGQTLFSNGFSAYAFMAFVLLSPPCVSALAAAKRELKSGKWFAFMLVFQTLAAYLTAFIINGAGFLITRFSGLLLSAITVIIILTVFVVLFRKTIKGGCRACGKCGKGVKKCPGNSKRNTTI